MKVFQTTNCLRLQLIWILLKEKFKDKGKVSKDILAFSELLFSQLGEDDFQLLNQRHFTYKNKITENASLENIDAYFEYHEVEHNGLMSAYNDVLPYGDQIQINTKNVA